MNDQTFDQNIENYMTYALKIRKIVRKAKFEIYLREYISPIAPIKRLKSEF